MVILTNINPKAVSSLTCPSKNFSFSIAIIAIRTINVSSRTPNIDAPISYHAILSEESKYVPNQCGRYLNAKKNPKHIADSTIHITMSITAGV
mmetsp:Transcript_62674/g.110629  ORF Transcript_62674/g.110629 Transcript_62674/m.110629 type:complete len:93 (+) Transcript_62674:1581-1859(+)